NKLGHHLPNRANGQLPAEIRRLETPCDLYITGKSRNENSPPSTRHSRKPACSSNASSVLLLKNRMCGSFHGALSEVAGDPPGEKRPETISARLARQTEFGTEPTRAPCGARTRKISRSAPSGSNRCSNTSKLSTLSNQAESNGRAASGEYLAASKPFARHNATACSDTSTPVYAHCRD